MYDGGKIVTGIIIFLIIITFPVWYNLSTGKYTYRPDPKIQTTAKQCVADKEYMVVKHMALLNNWRNTVVRTGERWTKMETTNQTIEMSLSRTCMDCHKNKSQFCDQCHNYLDVNPYCWDCHVEPKEDM